MSAEDGAILEAARRTSDLLGLAGFYPTSVSWQSEIGIGRGTKVVTPHFPELEGSKLIISPILQGRLDSQDWGSILASPLILKGLKGFYNIGALIRVSPGLLFLAGFLILSFAYPRRKLEHFRELDAARGGEWPEYGDHPSITKRIANLQNV